MGDTLPEGTDNILPGAMQSNLRDGGSPAEQIKAGAAELRDTARSKAEELRAQATDHARDYVEQGKEKASGALDGIAKLIGDNAAQIDDAIGSHYGDYARRAADAVSDAAGTLRDKDIEDLLDDARDLVRRSPGLAIGAAAAAGFLLARIIKSGSDALEGTAVAVKPQVDASRTADKRKGGDGPSAG